MKPASEPLSVRCQLRPHPTSACPAIRELSVVLCSKSEHELELTYVVVGRMEELSIPEPGASIDAEQLWTRTCCELFLSSELEDAYSEWNFSPSGQVTRFNFSGYRRREAMSVESTTPVRVRQAADRFELHVEVAVSRSFGSCRAGIAMVVEDARGSMSYWALRHPAPKPDFHDAGGFALQLRFP